MDARPPAFDLWLPGVVTPTLNVALRQHWSKRLKGTRSLAWEVRVAMDKVAMPVRPFSRALLVVERRCNGTVAPDYDGLVGGMKGLIDVLLPMHPTRRPFGLGFILDDNPNCLVLEARSLLVKRPLKGMRITITSLEEAAP